METILIAIILAVLLILADAGNSAFAAANDHVSALNRTIARAVVEARGDWYNQIGFPQQFYGMQLGWFSIWFYFMLAFLKVFLLMGIWPIFKEKDEDVSPVFSDVSGYGHDYVYYSLPSWPTYG